jgi:hypothetical protein
VLVAHGRYGGGVAQPVHHLAQRAAGDSEHGRLGRLGRVTAQVLGQGLDHDGRQGEVRRPAALLGGPIEKAPLTSRSCSATVEGGIARAMFRVAVSGRREQEASFLTVVVWRDQAEHAAESLSKGSRPARAQLQDHQLTDLVGRDGHRAHDAILFRCDELVAAGGVRAAWLALVSAHLRHWRAADRRRLRILRQTTRPWAETPGAASASSAQLTSTCAGRPVRLRRPLGRGGAGSVRVGLLEG